MLDAAEAHLRAGRVAEAIDVFRALLSANPDDVVLRGRVADAYRRAGNVERAFHHFHRAAALCVKANDLPGAVRMLEAADTVSPNEPEVLFRWAECLELLGHAEGLRPLLYRLVRAAGGSGDRRRLWALNRLVTIEPDNVDLAVAQARALAEAGRVDDAVDRWQNLGPALGCAQLDWVVHLRATAQTTDRADLGTTLARILLAHQRPRDAVAVLVPFYERTPDHVALLETVGTALEAMQAWDKVVPARLELLRAMIAGRKRAPALELVAGLLQTYPTDPRVLQACAAACKAFGLTGESSRLLFQLCQLLDRNGETAARDQILTLLLEDDPRHEGALEMAIVVLEGAGRASEAQVVREQLADVRGTREPSSMWSGAPLEAPSSADFSSAIEEISVNSALWSESSVLSLSDADVLAFQVESPSDEAADTNVEAGEWPGGFVDATTLQPDDVGDIADAPASFDEAATVGAPIDRGERPLSVIPDAPLAAESTPSGPRAPSLFDVHPTPQTPSWRRSFEDATLFEDPSLRPSTRSQPPAAVSGSPEPDDTDFTEELPTQVDHPTPPRRSPGAPSKKR